MTLTYEPLVVPLVYQVGPGWETVRVNVPDVALGAPLAPPVALKVRWYTPLSAVTGVSVILQVRMYSSVFPDPEVLCVQPGVVVGYEASEGSVPELMVMEA